MSTPIVKHITFKNTVRIIALTKAGLVLAELIKKILVNSAFSHTTSHVDIWFKPQPFTEKIQTAFKDGDKLIFICATGIVVRSLAPVLQNKHQDPPVLVVDELGQFVVPLLSGHEGGANHWAQQLSTELHAQAVITSAKAYVDPVYTVGMGCERDCPLSYLDTLLQESLVAVGLTIEQVDSFHSIDLKKDETQLLELAKKYDKPFYTWNQTELRSMEHLLSTKSDYVFNTVGVYGVAESACLLGVQHITHNEPELILTKQKNSKATCAIARSFSSV